MLGLFCGVERVSQRPELGAADEQGQELQRGLLTGAGSSVSTGSATPQQLLLGMSSELRETLTKDLTTVGDSGEADFPSPMS